MAFAIQQYHHNHILELVYIVKVETGRYGNKSLNLANRACDFCSTDDKTILDGICALPFADIIVEDEVHVLRVCPRYHQHRTNLREPLKCILFQDIADLFNKDNINEASRYIRRIFCTRFPINRSTSQI